LAENKIVKEIKEVVVASFEEISQYLPIGINEIRGKLRSRFSGPAL
jgi:hypothetical protein